MRGKRAVYTRQLQYMRITPADAGKTFEFGQVPFGLEDHPRGCGENAISQILFMGMIGSPPRMRGKLSDLANTPAKSRITPADAGKTVCLQHVTVNEEDHPRGCGEN